MWLALRLLKHSGLHFRRQAQIGPYFADFACHRAKLIVELDGRHHAEPTQGAHDQSRTAFLNAAGYQVLRFWNVDAFGNERELADYILSIANPPTRRGYAASTSPQGGGETELA